MKFLIIIIVIWIILVTPMILLENKIKHYPYTSASNTKIIKNAEYKLLWIKNDTCYLVKSTKQGLKCYEGIPLNQLIKCLKTDNQ